MGIRDNSKDVSKWVFHCGDLDVTAHILNGLMLGCAQFDETLTKSEQVEIPIQVNGKLRARITVPADIDDESLKGLALADERIHSFIEGKQIKKVIVVPKKLVNIVVSSNGKS